MEPRIIGKKNTIRLQNGGKTSTTIQSMVLNSLGELWPFVLILTKQQLWMSVVEQVAGLPEF